MLSTRYIKPLPIRTTVKPIRAQNKIFFAFPISPGLPLESINLMPAYIIKITINVPAIFKIQSDIINMTSKTFLGSPRSGFTIFQTTLTSTPPTTTADGSSSGGGGGEQNKAPHEEHVTLGYEQPTGGLGH